MNGTNVVMFPGLGAAYPGMIEKYLDAFPEDRSALAAWSDTHEIRFGADYSANPRERERTQQFEIHALNLLWWRRTSARISIPAVCGHSLGYYAAIVASGMLTEHDSFRLIDKAFSLGWHHFGHSEDKIFVITTKEPCDFTSLVRDVGVEVLSENNQLQRVLYGAQAQYEEVTKKLGGNLLGAAILDSSIPFHSSRMEAIREELRDEMSTLAVQPSQPRLQLWSHITARPLYSSEDALNLVIDQPSQTVHWLKLVDTLLQAGRFEFTEVGPNRILTQLVRWISPKLQVRFVDSLRRPG